MLNPYKILRAGVGRRSELDDRGGITHRGSFLLKAVGNMLHGNLTVTGGVVMATDMAPESPWRRVLAGKISRSDGQIWNQMDVHQGMSFNFKLLGIDPELNLVLKRVLSVWRAEFGVPTRSQSY